MVLPNVLSKMAQGKIRELKFRPTCDNITIMPVIYAAGKIRTPIMVIPGQRERFSKRGRGKFKYFAEFIPEPNYLFICAGFMCRN